MSANALTFTHITAAAFYVLLYLLLIFTVVGLPMVFLTLRERFNRRRMTAILTRKLNVDIDLDADDVRSLARANGVWPRNVKLTVEMALSDTVNPEHYAKLKALIGQIDRIEPFNGLPDEVRPSLQHFVKLCDQSTEGETHLWLSPIQRALGAYEDLKADVARTKRWTIFVNCLGAFGVMIGIVSFISTPSQTDIDKTVRQAVIKAVQETLRREQAGNRADPVQP